MRVVGPACESGRRDRDISRARLFAGLVEEPFGRASSASAAGAGRHAGLAGGEPEWMQLVGRIRTRLAPGHHHRGRLEPAAVDRRGDRVPGGRCARVGLDVLGDCVPPPQGHRHRTAPPVRLQHAAGAGAHRDTVPDHLGAVLFHRGGAGEDAAPGVGSRGRCRRHLVPVELEVRLPEGRFQGRHAQVRRSRPGPQSGDGLQARGQRLPR